MNNILGTSEDWKNLGFRCGVEIHHQINTRQKLFCHCPAGTYSPHWHAEVLRHMRPTMSELGEYDGTALMEFKTKKEIIYRLNRDYVCTYEMDDNPPFTINEEAVDQALTIALAFNCKMVSELHVIRKQYLDGSIPTGFQRTCIIGVDGILPLSNGREIRIIQVGLEEDSCREISDIGHRIIFSVDRLGIPLIEVVTDKQFETPWEVAEGVNRIGRLLRATGYARRGIGAGRQDVNVSITGSTRVEIKGVPRIPRIPYLTAHEARRQESLLNIRNELSHRGLSSSDIPGEGLIWDGKPDSFHRPELNACLSAGDKVGVVKLPNAKNLVSMPLTGERRFQDELSGRVRVIACLDQMPNILHTDGDTGGLDQHDSDLIGKFVNCGKDDIAVAVWGGESDVQTAMNEVLDRWKECFDGVPNETRQAMPDNTTDFERILPGPDRMYPDTDSAPKEIPEIRVEKAQKKVPENPWDREKRYKEMGLPEDIIDRLAISRFAQLFDKLVAEKIIAPMRAGELMIRIRTALSRREINVEALSDKHWELLLIAMGEGKVKREVLFDFIEAWSEKPGKSIDQVLEDNHWLPADDEETCKIINDSIRFALSERPERSDLHEIIASGAAMNKLIGRIDGNTVNSRITDALKLEEQAAY